LTAGSTLALNFAVASGSPAFRITQIRAPNADPGSFNWSPFPATMRPGQSNYTIGVASADLPASGATLTLAGDGLTVGTPDFQSLAGLNFISVSLSVASNATAGLRSFLVQRGSDVAYANGYLEIQPTVPDFNFDGLDDWFQRQYFPLFTVPEAAPDADPDGDAFNNHSEYIAGTNPTNSLSLLKIDSVVLNTNGSTLAWESVPGKRYQVFGRLDLDNAPWQAVGAPVTRRGRFDRVYRRFRHQRFSFLPRAGIALMTVVAGGEAGRAIPTSGPNPVNDLGLTWFLANLRLGARCWLPKPKRLQSPRPPNRRRTPGSRLWSRWSRFWGRWRTDSRSRCRLSILKSAPTRSTP